MNELAKVLKVLIIAASILIGMIILGIFVFLMTIILL